MPIHCSKLGPEIPAGRVGNNVPPVWIFFEIRSNRWKTDSVSTEWVKRDEFWPQRQNTRLHSGGVPRRTQKGRTRERPVASFIPIHWSRTVALTNADRWLFILHCFPLSSCFWSLFPIQISYRRLHYPETALSSRSFCFNDRGSARSSRHFAAER